MTTTTTTATPARIVRKGHGGWTYSYTGTKYSGARSSCTGYGPETVARGTDEGNIHPDAVIVDLTTVDALEILAVSGPMIDPTLPAGTVNKLGEGRVPFDKRPQPDRPAHCAKLGNAEGLDEVAEDVYLFLAERFGAEITPAAVVLEAYAAAQHS